MNRLKRLHKQCLHYQKANRYVNYSLIFTYVIAVSWLSLKPTVEVASPLYNDKVAHCISYALFTLLAWRLCQRQAQFIYATLVVLAYSVLIEIIQPYTGRMFSWWDIVANAVGAGVMFIYLYPESFAKAS